MLQRYVRKMAVGVLMAGAAYAAVVTVDHTTVYQTIDGFGAHGSMNVWWSGGPFFNTTFLNSIVDDLGLTINRNEFYPDYEPTNDNGDPNVLGTFNQNGEFVTKQKPWINALKDKAAASGEPMKFIATYWSPPAWMKQNSSTVGENATTNILRTGVEEELGEYGIATLKAYKDHCGVDLYALSMQNEPAFAQYFNSCVYTPVRYRDVFKIFAPKVAAAYPDLKFFGAEHMLSNWGTYEGQVISDTLARRHMDILAVHGYSDGVNPTPASQSATLWKRAWTNTKSASKTVWMTETSGFSNDWSGAQGMSNAMYSALKYGHIGGWVWWQLAGTHTAGEILMPGGTPGKLFYAAKNYYRYIRPGALGIESTTDDTTVANVAFHHPQNRTLTIVLINWSSSTKSVTLSGTALPSFTAYRTSSGENCANVGTVSGSLTIPAGALVTLYGTNYNPPTTVDKTVRALSRPQGVCRADVFAVDGRLIARVENVRTGADGAFAWDGRSGASQAAAGVYCARVTDSRGVSAPARAVVSAR